MNIEEFRRQWFDDRLYVNAHTSGSTGTPKEIKLLKSDMRVSARNTLHYFNITAQSTLACALSPDYIAGKMMAVRAWQAGCRLLMIPPSNKLAIPRDVIIDLLAIVPSQAVWLVDHPENSRSIKRLLIGGAPLDGTLLKRLLDAGYAVYESYGMTETCSHVALRKNGASFFEALPGVSAKLDSRGCLVLDLPDYSVRQVITNDLVDLKDSRRFIWLGRYDNVINSGGVKVYPEHQERLYREAGLQGKFYISPVKHTLWGTALGMVIEGEELSDNEIIEILRDGSAKEKQLIKPSVIIHVKQIECTSSGKIKRTPIEDMKTP